jgi:DNA replication protein DnaC
MERARERQRMMERTMPEPARCRVCRIDFKPEWDSFEGRWKYPDMAILPLKPGAMNGLCVSCRRLMHIKENITKYLDKAGIPPKYLDCSFDNFKAANDARHAHRICKEYIVEPSGNLFLYGGYGTGKTHLAVAIARELLLQGKELLFTSVPRLLFEIRKAFKQDADDTEAFYVEKYSSCPFLILDDFGLEKSTEWARQTLDYIIYERDNHLRPTVITSNFSLDELTEKMDGRISSRLAGMGKVVLFKGEDYRLRRNR